MKVGLALSGTGASWLIHAGALEAFEDAGVDPTVLYGTSGGSHACALYACGVTPKEILALAHETDFAEYLDMKPHRLLWQLGMNDGRKLEALIEEWTRGMTFGDLAAYQEAKGFGPRYLFVTGTDILTRSSDLSPHRRRVVSFNAWSTPGMRIARAVRISISLPFVFAPVSGWGTLWVDGGVNAVPNYPFELLENAVADWPDGTVSRALPLLGVKQTPARESQGSLDAFAPLESRPGARRRLWLPEFVRSLVSTMRDDQQSAYVRKRYASRTVFVPVRRSESLALDETEKGSYYALGRRCTREALQGGLVDRAVGEYGRARTNTDGHGRGEDAPQ